MGKHKHAKLNFIVSTGLIVAQNFILHLKARIQSHKKSHRMSLCKDLNSILGLAVRVKEQGVLVS